jgi:hypothetical protein
MTLAQQFLLSTTISIAMTAAPFVYFWPRKQKLPIQMDPLGETGAFMPLMEHYLRLADGLGAVTLVSLGYIASPVVLHPIVQSDREHLGSLTLLNACIPFAVAFLCILFFRVWLVIWYENYRHERKSYTPLRYAVIKSLPAAAFLNLIVGFGTIAVDVALWIHDGGGNPPAYYGRILPGAGAPFMTVSSS